MTAVAGEAGPPVALYVHFPFCLSICPYCDFVVYAGRAARGPDNRVAALVDALATEIALRATDAPLASIYLGGGTPSLMSALQVERVLAAAESAFGLRDGAEITIEVNPGDGERGDLRGFRASGVNRLSIGAQSMSPVELRRLGRRHSPADVAQTLNAGRAAGFDNISIDLLYDVPGQTLESWRGSLGAVLALEPEHVSAYALTLDGGPEAADHLAPRPGATRWRARARTEQDEDRAADMYELADETLARAGVAWYEVSNWARPGKESRHNLAYWLGAAYEAVGPGAHAFDGYRTRRWNAANLDRYVVALAAGRLPPGESDVLDAATALAERATLRLRTRFGLAQPFPDGLIAALDWARDNGVVEPAADGGMSLTRRGRLLSNELFLRLLVDEDRVKHRPGDLERPSHSAIR